MFKKFWQYLRLPKTQRIFIELYKNIYGAQLSKQDRAQSGKDDFSLVYGEIIYPSFINLLHQVKLTKNDVFYDLGSGTGKAVFAAALSTPIKKAVGIEILPSLYQASLNCLSRYQKLVKEPRSLEFYLGNFYNFDITTADVIFINATGFFGENLAALIKKLNTVKSGTKIIITSKLLPKNQFKLLHQGKYRMSWGYSRVSIYTHQPSS